MEQQLANMKNSLDERIFQGIQETQEAWQEASARASEAEERARELEKTISNLEEQLHVDRIHQQLWPPSQPEARDTHVVQRPSGDTLMGGPATQVAGNSNHDTSMEEPDDDDDTEMREVNRIIF